MSSVNNGAAPLTLTQSKPTDPVIGVPFTPSAKNCMVSITVRIVAPPGATGRIELRSDTAATPTTQIARHRVSNALTLLGLSGSISVDKTLTHHVPVGNKVVLASTIESGSPVFTVIDYALVEEG